MCAYFRVTDCCSWVSLRLWLPALLCLLLCTAASGAELIANGGFELSSSNMPAGWNIRGTTAGLTAVVDSNNQVSGVNSLRIATRSDRLDGPQQSLRNALNAAGSGKGYAFRFQIKTDDVASVRALLKFADASGQQVDKILAEAQVLEPDEWVTIEGSSLLAWQGSLTSASVVFEVVQLTRKTGVLPGNLVPAYNIDDVSMDLDLDGDYLFDREEAALGFSTASADSDADGLPDRWEYEHGFSPAENDANLDNDDDSFSNLEEYFAATDPHDAGQYPGKPANHNANPATRAVLQWLALLPSRPTGARLAIGQTVSDLSDPLEYPAMIDQLGTVTGHYPAILQLAIEPTFDRFGLALQIDAVEQHALDYWQAGGLVMLKWAMYNPWVTLGPNVQTGVDIPGLLDPANSSGASQAANQAAHDTMVSWMSEVADAMQRLDEQGVVVMFRPLSEMNGGWFWWGLRDRAHYIALWQFLYNYFTTERGLDNLIWVYESDSATHAPIMVGGPGYASDYYYPGDEYVDVMAHNLYNATWNLAFDANEVYARYPKVYGIPQAGPDRANRDGFFDNLIYLHQSQARLPRSSFFVVWNSFTNNVGLQRIGIVDNVNAVALMQDAAIVTREAVAGLIVPVQTLPDTDVPNAVPEAQISGGNRNIDDTDGIAGEVVSLTGTATDSNGSITTTQWLVNGAVVATGTEADLVLGDGDNLVTLRAVDDLGASSAAVVTVTVEGPSTLPRIAGYSTLQGVATSSNFAIGMQLNSNPLYVALASTTDRLRITGYLYPQTSDLDAIADVFVVVQTPIGWRMRDAAGRFVLWNSRLNTLVPAFESVTLADGLGLELFSGLQRFPGKYRFYLGYMRTDVDELVHTLVPAIFTIL